MSAKTCNVIAAVAAAVVLIPTATVAQSVLAQAQQAVIAKKIGSTSATPSTKLIHV